MSEAVLPQKTVVIIQPSYIPWKGFFDLVNSADEIVFYEDVQFTKRDWRSRNAIKTAQGLQWLTVPCSTKGKYTQLVCETVVSDRGWAKSHWRSITHAYGRAPFFDAYKRRFASAYDRAGELEHLSDINKLLFETIAEILGVTKRVVDSRTYAGAGTKTERLLSICLGAGATKYISGPAAKDYIDEPMFAAAGVELAYMDYSGYSEYPQLYPPFEHAVSVLDLIFNVGDQATRYLKSFAT